MLKEGDSVPYKRIKDLREDADLSQNEVAKILFMSQTGYSKYERQENIPISVLISLAKFYKVSLDYMLGLSDEK
ncbi:MAG: helix-turn-helix transcriptional regulator [Bacillota bacterium]|nr:helix-turn-helix transcriptional regulator [Bacillota bacterium]